MLDLNGTPEDSEMYDSLYAKVEQALADRNPEFENRGLKAISALE